MADSVKGMASLLKKLHRLGDAKEIDAITEGAAMEIQLSAVQRAPVNQGDLKLSIYNNRIKESHYEVVVGSSYGPFVEFGTGPQVQVPAAFSQMALKFKGGNGGSFEDGLESIKDWCRKKGIEESAAYPIFMSILKKGMRPQPFLYPAYIKGSLDYIQELRKYLKELTK